MTEIQIASPFIVVFDSCLCFSKLFQVKRKVFSCILNKCLLKEAKKREREKTTLFFWLHYCFYQNNSPYVIKINSPDITVKNPAINTSQIIILIQLLKENYSETCTFQGYESADPCRAPFCAELFYIAKTIYQVAGSTDVLHIADPNQCLNYQVLNANQDSLH